MSDKCTHCGNCKNGCVSVCKCCGKCQACGRLAAAPVPTVNPTPFAPQVAPWVVPYIPAAPIAPYPPWEITWTTDRITMGALTVGAVSSC